MSDKRESDNLDIMREVSSGRYKKLIGLFANTSRGNPASRQQLEGLILDYMKLHGLGANAIFFTIRLSPDGKPERWELTCELSEPDHRETLAVGTCG